MIEGNPRPADPLDQLRGLHLPEATGFWPPARGWWLVGGLALLLIAATVIAVRVRRRGSRARALRELDELASRWR